MNSTQFHSKSLAYFSSSKWVLLTIENGNSYMSIWVRPTSCLKQNSWDYFIYIYFIQTFWIMYPVSLLCRREAASAANRTSTLWLLYWLLTLIGLTAGARRLLVTPGVPRCCHFPFSVVKRFIHCTQSALRLALHYFFLNTLLLFGWNEEGITHPHFAKFSLCIYLLGVVENIDHITILKKKTMPVVRIWLLLSFRPRKRRQVKKRHCKIVISYL